jgi:hypothetical protein
MLPVYCVAVGQVSSRWWSLQNIWTSWSLTRNLEEFAAKLILQNIDLLWEQVKVLYKERLKLMYLTWELDFASLYYFRVVFPVGVWREVRKVLVVVLKSRFDLSKLEFETRLHPCGSGKAGKSGKQLPTLRAGFEFWQSKSKNYNPNSPYRKLWFILLFGVLKLVRKWNLLTFVSHVLCH